ncbi:carboxymuconolactone decarboxylase family protein [Alkalibacter saccharofermentans]|uniref:Alkylhydroperoxidase family enzyme, contains CxxC motif n=1 Tax=Alkalibacter saccharofermentans DSM 14828 TaxID=1120975 RepID=A0A1M4UVL4_9FIRM|nr:carboxymuconolactone decarboxylase family protein [Alkalibacter saccharofermentans]SHE60734.1 Alkylhydroperoxidase family enzyme, contains CxxC motif [Alkalibacter saccharofermentans DSM 14828]
MGNTAFIKPPAKIPFFIKLGIAISKKITKKDLLAPKLLAWYPKAAFSSGVLEAMVAHGNNDLNKRILKLIRIQSSISIACPFCLDMNSFEYEKNGISDEEMSNLVNQVNLDLIETFSLKEKLALEYTIRISKTPVDVPLSFFEKLRSEFTEREIVILASTAAQVNYWARLLKSLGVPPAGFSDQCDLSD